MSTNTPHNFGQQPESFGQQPYSRGPRPLFTSKEAVNNLMICDLPLIITFAGLFQPYFTVSSQTFGSDGLSWADVGTEGPFIITLIFLLIAFVPLVLQFLPRIRPTQLLSMSGLITAAGVIVLINVARNFSPDTDNLADMDALGFSVSRGLGFWFLLLGGLGLTGAGVLFTSRIKKAIRTQQGYGAFGPDGGYGSGGALEPGDPMQRF